MSWTIVPGKLWLLSSILRYPSNVLQGPWRALSRGDASLIRTDNGPELTSKEFEWWGKEHVIEIQFIQPGRPMQNGYIERFNRVFRESILAAYLFTDIREVRALTEEWI